MDEDDVGPMSLRRNPRPGAVGASMREGRSQSGRHGRDVALQRSVTLHDAGDSAHQKMRCWTVIVSPG
jgi:hypothetical protein